MDFGGILFLFPIIFIAITISFLFFTCGKKQFQVLSVKRYRILNIIKIACIVLSSIFIVLSLLYAIILSIAGKQLKHLGFTNKRDSSEKIIGNILGFLFIIYYLICVGLFVCERRIFNEVGTSEKPGPAAKFDLYGNPIINNNTGVNILNPGNGMVLNVVQIEQSNNIQNVKNLNIKNNIIPQDSDKRMN